MAVDKLVDSTQLDADLTSVANAIRTKGGTSSQLAFPAGFVSAVQAIPTGGVTPTGTKQISITQNGTTTEDVTNYASAQITANVPNTYSAGDEGKVVSNGALVVQGSDTVTQNDTYDTTLISSLTVNVSGGGGGGANPLYPFGHYYVSVTGASATYDVYQKSSGGAHVKIAFGNITLSSGGTYFNLTNGAMQTTGSPINNRPTWFTIPSGKQCVLKYANIVNAGGITFALNFKLANSTTSTAEFGTGDGAWTGEKTINATLSSAENIGCLFLFAAVRSANSNSVIEFDVSLTVDGVEYF